jgi:hypothetical protein
MVRHFAFVSDPPITSLCPLFVLEQHLDGVPLVLVGAAQAVDTVAASRLEQSIANCALPNFCVDFTQACPSRSFKAVEAITYPQILVIVVHGDRRHGLANGVGLGVVVDDVLADESARLSAAVNA